MTIEISEIIKYLGLVVIPLVGYVWRSITSLRASHELHRTHVAERYVTKDDMNITLSRVYDALDRIEKKLDTR